MGRGDDDGETGGRDTKRRRKNEGEGGKKGTVGAEGDSRTTTKDKAVTDTFQVYHLNIRGINVWQAGQCNHDLKSVCELGVKCTGVHLLR